MTPPAQELSRSLRRRGAIVLALFAMLWAVVGRSGLSAGTTVALVGALAVTALAVFAALRPAEADRERVRTQPANWHRQVGVVNLTQFVAIGVVVAVFVSLGLPSLVPPLVCLVVGAHFFPLTMLFDQPEYRILGATLSLIAAAGLVLLAIGASAETSRLVTGFGAAIALWAVSLRLGIRGRRTHHRTAT